MTRNWIVLGDVTTSGGRVVTASPFTEIDGKGVARRNDRATCPSHSGVFPIVGGFDPATMIDGSEVALHGAELSCGCRVLSTQQLRVFVHAGAASGAVSPASLASEPSYPQTPVSGSGAKPMLHKLNDAADAGLSIDDCEVRFRKVSRVVLANEGGFVDDPDDAGGATNMGIAWRTWQTYALEDLGVESTLENLRNLTVEQAETIYRKRYWEPRGFCDIHEPRTALMIYDWTITSGKAVREVQKVLRDTFGAEVVVDNDMGPQTIAAVNAIADQDALVEAIAAARKDYYQSLTYNRDRTRNRNQKFLRGWLARVERCLEINP